MTTAAQRDAAIAKLAADLAKETTERKAADEAINDEIDGLEARIANLEEPVDPPPPDPAPVISNVTVSAITTTGATISWSLSEPGTGQIEYFPASGDIRVTTLEPGLLTAHSQSIAGLTPDTTYWFSVHSKDSAGQETASPDDSFKTAAVVVVPPPVDPPPTGAPFPPPVTTRTVTAPAPSGGDDFARLNDFIATVPDGSVIVFPAGTYKLSQGVMLGTRSNLVFQLGTAVFQLTNPDRSQHTSSAFIPGYSYQSRSFVSGGSHLKFVDGTVIGGDPNPGAPQPLRGENQHAVRANGTNFIEVTGMTVKAVSGDHVFLHGCNDVWVHHNHVITAGRNCVSVISGARVLVEDNQHDRCGYVTFDIEPNFATESSADIIYRRNTAGSWGLDWVSVDGGARGADIRRVTIADNTTTDPLDLHIDNKGGTNGNTAARMKDVVVTGNKGDGTPAGPRLFFGRIDGVTVKGNTQALSSGQLSAFTLCTGIVQS